MSILQLVCVVHVWYVVNFHVATCYCVDPPPAAFFKHMFIIIVMVTKHNGYTIKFKIRVKCYTTLIMSLYFLLSLPLILEENSHLEYVYSPGHTNLPVYSEVYILPALIPRFKLRMSCITSTHLLYRVCFKVG